MEPPNYFTGHMQNLLPVGFSGSHLSLMKTIPVILWDCLLPKHSLQSILISVSSIYAQHV